MPWSDPAKFKSVGSVVVHTCYVPTPSGECFEITIAADHEPKAKRTVFVTTDAAVYERALKAEGCERRFTVSSHPGYRPDGKACRVLVSLTENVAKKRAAS
jgi:predicted GNAT family acetyltransferase